MMKEGTFILVIQLCLSYNCLVDCSNLSNLCWNNEEDGPFQSCTCFPGSEIVIECHLDRPNLPLWNGIKDTVNKLVLYGEHACDILADMDRFLGNVTIVNVQSNDKGSVQRISYDWMEKLYNLRELRLHRCNIRDIETGAFRNLQALTHLDLSGNTYLSFTAFTQGLVNFSSEHLRVLNLSGIYNHGDQLDLIDYPMLQRLSVSQLEVLDASWTGLYGLLDSFTNLPNLRVLNFTATSIVGDGRCVASMMSLDRLEVMVLNKWPYIPRGFDSIEHLETPKYVKKRQAVGHPCPAPYQLINQIIGCHTVMKSLRTLEIRFSDLDSMYLDFTSEYVCFENNTIVNLNLEGSFTSKQLGVLKEMTRLKYFDISYIKSTFDGPVIHSQGFQEMPVLEILLIPGIRMNLYSADELGVLLNKNSFLTIIDMSSNGLQYIPTDFLANKIQLRVVNISRNILTDLNINISAVRRLDILDVSFNRLKSISAVTIDGLRAVSTNRTVRIILDHNSFVCDCALVSFAVIETFETTLSCLLDDLTYTVGNETFRELPEKLRKLCDPDTISNTAILGISLSSGVVLVGLTLVIIFLVRRKQKILHQLNLITLPILKRKRDLKPKFPVFLAYCSKDYEFAVNTLCPRLNRRLNELLKGEREDTLVVVNDKHFLPGSQLDEIISRTIQECHVTLAVVSNEFMQSPWCQFEVIKTFNENVPLIPLYISEIDPKYLKGVTKELFNTRARITWPRPRDNEEDKQKQDRLEKETVDLICKTIMTHMNPDKKEK